MTESSQDLERKISVSCSQEDSEELAGDSQTGELAGPVSPVHQPHPAPSSQGGEGTAVLGEAHHYSPPLLLGPGQRPVSQIVQVEHRPAPGPNRENCTVNFAEGFI